WPTTTRAKESSGRLRRQASGRVWRLETRKRKSASWFLLPSGKVLPSAGAGSEPSARRKDALQSTQRAPARSASTSPGCVRNHAVTRTRGSRDGDVGVALTRRP